MSTPLVSKPFVARTLATELPIAQSLFGHARSCKKSIDACKPCTLAIQWFADLPLPLLSLVLQDRPKPHSL